MSINPLAAGFDYPMVPPVANEPQEKAGQNSSRAVQARPEAPVQAGVDIAVISQSPRPVENTSESLKTRKDPQKNNPDPTQRESHNQATVLCTCGQTPCICIKTQNEDQEPNSSSTDSEQKTAIGREEEEKRQTSTIEEELTPKEEAVVREMKQRDQEVRAHEQAHIAAGGQYVGGGARFSFETGPDGRQYATGGEVSIDASEAQTPEATIQKAAIIQKAALAPASPSAQDRAVAAKAAQMGREAQTELSKEKQEQAELAARDLASKGFSPKNIGGAQENLEQGATTPAKGINRENPFPVPGTGDAPPPFSVRNKRLNLVI
ncbi:putative metalloprotease CJM1_0395 family protein [Dethiosulfatarculus sandiegensis]|uniref:putative metalloprotease CJM1_0395 family protein n=1 Tax=Dethiosulfatarculus sandiegensis TaxID=1429043 RepID=UPI000A668CB5|nr:putative metalloprotease CJM1_0395 family protein [Dethiosulfatarculus sandiegensis]